MDLSYLINAAQRRLRIVDAKTNVTSFAFRLFDTVAYGFLFLDSYEAVGIFVPLLHNND